MVAVAVDVAVAAVVVAVVAGPAADEKLMPVKFETALEHATAPPTCALVKRGEAKGSDAVYPGLFVAIVSPAAGGAGAPAFGEEGRTTAYLLIFLSGYGVTVHL